MRQSTAGTRRTRPEPSAMSPFSRLLLLTLGLLALPGLQAQAPVRDASDLQKPAVMARYQSINASRLQYSTYAIKFALVEEWREQVARTGQQIESLQRDAELRLRMLNATAAKPAPPVPSPAPPPLVQPAVLETPPTAMPAPRASMLTSVGTPMRRQGGGR